MSESVWISRRRATQPRWLMLANSCPSWWWYSYKAACCVWSALALALLHDLMITLDAEFDVEYGFGDVQWPIIEGVDEVVREAVEVDHIQLVVVSYYDCVFGCDLNVSYLVVWLLIFCSVVKFLLWVAWNKQLFGQFRAFGVLRLEFH